MKKENQVNREPDGRLNGDDLVWIFQRFVYGDLNLNRFSAAKEKVRVTANPARAQKERAP